MTDKPAAYRWNIFFGYMLLTIGTQLAWFSYAPITAAVSKDLHVSIEHVGWLSIVFSGLYLLLGLPAGRFADQQFRQSLAIGAWLNVLGVIIRVIAPQSFLIQLLGQLILAIGQPFVINAVTGLATRYFPVSERPTVIASGTAAMFMGMLLGSLTSPWLHSVGGLPLVLIAHGIVVLIGGVWTILNLRRINSSQQKPSGLSITMTYHGNIEEGLSWLWSNALMWKLAILMFVGFGVFSGLSTWLETLLLSWQINDKTAGYLLVTMITTGVIGLASFPSLVAARGYRKPALISAFVVSLLMITVLLSTGNVIALAIALGLGGFFLLPCFPLALELAEKYSDVKQQGTAVGFLMISGNAGALALTLLMGLFIEQGPLMPLFILSVTLLAGLILSVTLPRHLVK